MAFRFMSQNINIKFKIRILTPATPGDQLLFEIYRLMYNGIESFTYREATKWVKDVISGARYL